MNHIRGLLDDTSKLKPDERLTAMILAVNLDAAAFVPKDKIEHQARLWLSGVPRIPQPEHWDLARSMALQLALITPSLAGLTAFDRQARAVKGHPPEEAAGAALVQRGRPMLARLTGKRFENLATGEARDFVPSHLSQYSGDGPVFGRFSMTSAGAVLATGPLVRLDKDSLAVALGFVRPDKKGLTNPVRCAEAIFRLVVRQGLAYKAATEPPFDPVGDPLDELAAQWASLGGEPGSGELAKARSFAAPLPLLNALISVTLARDEGMRKLAIAYRRIAAEIIDLMVLRASYGSSRSTLDEAAAVVDHAVRTGRCGSDTKALFNELSERARLAMSKRQSADGGELDKLIGRIRGLREKTVAQGCTEQEAYAAAAKVAELLDRYGLSLSELDLRKQTCEGVGIETGRKRRGPIDDCMGTIAAYFDCKVWGETAGDGSLHYVFFGMPGDVQAAVYLHDLIARAFAAETDTFRAGEFYGSLLPANKRNATVSFQAGLANGIIMKLGMLRQERETAREGGNGRALVPVKRAMIDEEMERLGLHMRQINKTRRLVISDAFEAGKDAGARFEYTAGITSGVG